MRALATTVLYLLAVLSVAVAQIAWGRPTPLRLAGWAIALGVALGLGERFGLSLEAVDEKRRDRMAMFLGTVQLSVLVLALVLAAGRPTPGLLQFLTGVLSGYQLLVLLLARLASQPRGVVGQSVALVALASLRGGPVAAVAVGGTLALVGLYVGLDHHSRLLVAHRVDEVGHAPRAFWRTAALVLPVALVVGLALHRLAPPPVVQSEPAVEEQGYVPLGETPQAELDLQALRALVVTGLMGAVAVYFLGRWLVRSRRGEVQAIETPEPLRGAVERIRKPEAKARRLPEYAGRRGRIVRAYLNLLRGAERAGFPRRAHETPDEFGAALGEPRGPLLSTTATFVRARYGPFDVTPDDVAGAERGADAVLGHLSRHPPKRRAAMVRDADTGREQASER